MDKKIILAKSAGFCFGVQRAVDTVEEELKKSPKLIYTYGPIIHNENVVEDLKEKGVHVMEEGDDLSASEPGVMVIRSHGVSKKIMDDLSKKEYKVVDATCPFVKKIHNIVSEYSEKGYHILIIGNESHPEIQGIIGWIHGDSYTVIDSEEEAEQFSIENNTKICLVAQTTYNHNKFENLVEIIKHKGYDVFAVSTICNATHERQEEAAQIAELVDVMMVIGGRSSSNSRKLYEICKDKCERTFFVQTAKDIDLSVLKSTNTIGITAGASTPNNIIEEVQNTCQRVLNNY
ncbi:MAG: 4-hydroxy-3-methylbut-2-enyl diphosphate reductase [Lachnospiraceae bacterium]|nr:4-hydroxy-3-methylbut-2-enyl diphosphate reductase [Lachnospiraceae bacterium]